MKLNSSDLIQGLGALAIIAGLVLVVVELRQSQAIAEAQIISDITGQIVDVSLASVGEEMNEILARSCNEPDKIKRSDIDALSNYYNSRFQNVVARKSIYSNTGLLDDTQWRSFARNIGTAILGTPYGRYWWESQRDFWIADSLPEITKIFEEAKVKGIENWGQGCWWSGELPAYLQTLDR